MNKFKKYWTVEHQTNFKKCYTTWSNFFQDNGADLTKGAGSFSAEYKQKVFLNYLYSLTFTGQFEEAERLMVENIGKKLKAGTLFDMKRMKTLNNYLKKEFEAHSKEKGWVKS